ncbi:DUF3352 domain-containing protein [Argonema antarcticum]|uniref:DUF3352 domain-containing protein n=1 Tax=Argonema antarcticum TaxID=2942763 RepID=UPI002013828F|nr:DUF3352 domain-containing protein [Argonema antarcticum]MCL1475340.1 DUF3352 domain-containing protein [Argonema antarcticum A004/B2]
MSEKKRGILNPVIIGAAVIVAGGVVGYLYLKGVFSDATSPLASAKVVPDEALMTGMISTDPKAWGQLQQFGTPEAQAAINKGLNDFNKQMTAESKIDYAKDIYPWLGSVMFAVLPSDPNQPSKQNLLMVVGIKDKISAWNFSNKIKSQIKGQETDYNGVKILETTGSSGKTYSAVLNDHLVLAPERKAVEQAIDTFKGQPSFAKKENAASILSKGVDVQNTLAQIYIPEYGNVIQQLIASNPNSPPLPPQSLAQLKQVKSLVMGLGVDNSGLRMKAIGKVDPSLIKVEYKPTPGKVVAQFPLETIALISGQGISRGWAAVVAESQKNSQLQQQLDQYRQQMKTSYNLDLDKDIFGWMDGEFALAAISSNQGFLAQFGFGGALVFKTSDRQTAEATLAKIDAIAQTNSITVAERNVQGKTVKEWKLPSQEILLGYGWLDNESVFVAVGSSLIDVMVTNSNSLDGSESFKAIAGSLQKPNIGYFYVDMDKTMSLVNRNLAAAQNNPIPAEANAILTSIRGIGMTATQPDASTSQMEMLLALKPKTK